MKILPLSATLAALSLTHSALASDVVFFVGTYTKPNASKGIYHYVLDDETGKVTGGELAAETPDPTFLAVHPGGRFLYAANETNPGEASAFAIGDGGKLTLLNMQSAKGGGTCHIAVDTGGKNVLVANYGTGSVAVLPIKDDGSLAEATGFDQHAGGSVDKARQSGPHAHSIYVDPSARFVYACDLGTDRIDAYKFDAAKGTIAPDEAATGHAPPGSGPRHLAFHPKADFAYVINEMLSTVSVFARTPSSGALRIVQTVSTLPADFSGKSTTAEIFVHPSGKFLYGSNRGHDSIALFSIGADGTLALKGHTPTGGKTPRNFALDPSGRWLIAANQDSNDFFVFKIDQETGALAPTGQRLECGAPVCIVFAPR